MVRGRENLTNWQNVEVYNFIYVRYKAHSIR